MDSPIDLKPDLQNMLLGPLSLATEIYGSLLPGCVLTSLFCIKRQWVVAILSYPLLGYKTKVAVALVVSYIAGKIVVGILAIVSKAGMVVSKKLHARNKKLKKNAEAPTQNKTLLQTVATLASDGLETAPEPVRSLLGGMLAAPLFSSSALHHISWLQASWQFYSSMGWVLVGCSAIQGDGHWRTLEFVIGVVLLVRASLCVSEREQLVAGLMGAAFTEFLSKFPVNISGLMTALQVYTKLATTPSPVTVQNSQPAPVEAEAVEPSS